MSDERCTCGRIPIEWGTIIDDNCPQHGKRGEADAPGPSDSNLRPLCSCQDSYGTWPGIDPDCVVHGPAPGASEDVVERRLAVHLTRDQVTSRNWGDEGIDAGADIEDAISEITHLRAENEKINRALQAWVEADERRVLKGNAHRSRARDLIKTIRKYIEDAKRSGMREAALRAEVERLKEALKACESNLRLVHGAAGKVPKNVPMPTHSTFAAWKMAAELVAPEQITDRATQALEPLPDDLPPRDADSGG